MIRIAGVNFAREKLVIISLTKIFGIGKTSAKQIIEKADILVEKRGQDLTDEEVIRIRTLVEKDYQVEGDLRRWYSQNLKRLVDIRSFKGRRHRLGLPVRGQRTRTNARTQKRRRVRT